jgi:ABC-type nitrate/sulfonate/bicarbonate transport system ATPase subunit
MVHIDIIGVGKQFRKSEAAISVLNNIDLAVSSGSIVAVRGDNGCGKSTLLNIIAGIEPSSEGDILYDGSIRRVNRLGYVQQDYTSSLLPWFDVLNNVGVPLQIQGFSRNESRKNARAILDTLGFNTLPSKSYPHQLSGGQRQRVSVARALIHEPQLLLLDEPFANLDAHTTRDLQETILEVHAKKRPTIIYVSHELDHCIYLADKIVVLHGAPARIFAEFEVPLPRPRKRAMLLSRAYADIRSGILAVEEQLYATAH